MTGADTTYSCQECRIHLHQASAAAMCEVEHGQFLCIRCNQPMPPKTNHGLDKAH